MYSRSAKGGEKGDPNRNPWLAKMVACVLLFIAMFIRHNGKGDKSALETY